MPTEVPLGIPKEAAPKGKKKRILFPSDEDDENKNCPNCPKKKNKTHKWKNCEKLKQ